ncbi:protein lifeguard, partial [Tremellales sp. Uapishka_1]
MSALPQYTDEPVSPIPSKKNYGTTPAEEPLLAAQAGTSRNAWMDQPAADDLPDDFKFGVNVYDCDAEIRLAFIRKVYSILFIQLLLTSVIAFGMSFPAAVDFTRNHQYLIYIPMVGSFASLLGVYWKRHQHPANLILLGLFTVFESLLIGTITSYYESRIVLQALFITLGVFTGLTLFTFQTKFDFVSIYPFLFAGLMGLLTASLVQIFLPFNQNVDLAVAGFSVLIFSGFVLYDTQQIMKRLSVDEAILGAVCLYTDLISLFLNILRVLNNLNSRSD